MKQVFQLLLSFGYLTVVSCTSSEIRNQEVVSPDAIYFDYQVNGEEADGYVTVLLQFRVGGRYGSTMELEKPSHVELDGEALKQNRAPMTGAFYEIMKPVREFTGKHVITFIDINKKRYREEFNFQPVSLLTTIPETVERGDLSFEMEGLSPIDYVRVILTDTAFRSEGINRLDTVKDGRVLISKADLRSLVDGPVHLELYKENDKPVRDKTLEGGKLSISFGLYRDFRLTTIDSLELAPTKSK